MARDGRRHARRAWHVDGGALTTITLRRLQGPADDAAVHALFRATVAMGRPLPFDHPLLDDYAALCLDWYLDEGREHVAVIDAAEGVGGYALVCPDTDAYRRWVRRPALRFARRSIAAMARFDASAAARHFLLLRIRDGVTLRAAPAPRPVHAHLNLAHGMQGTWAGPLLRDYIDAECRRVGAAGWFGEINAKVGRRATALERLVGPVVHREANRTCTWLAGTPIERLTVVRDLS